MDGGRGAAFSCLIHCCSMTERTWQRHSPVLSTHLAAALPFSTVGCGHPLGPAPSLLRWWYTPLLGTAPHSARKDTFQKHSAGPGVKKDWRLDPKMQVTTTYRQSSAAVRCNAAGRMGLAPQHAMCDDSGCSKRRKCDNEEPGIIGRNGEASLLQPFL